MKITERGNNLLKKLLNYSLILTALLLGVAFYRHHISGTNFAVLIVLMIIWAATDPFKND